MARLTLYIVALALGAAAAVGLVSCGGSDDELLPGDTADEIAQNLDSVEALVDAGECSDAGEAAQRVSDQVAGLPTTVDRELRQRLAAGAELLEEVVSTDCEEAPTVTQTTEPTDEDTETTETTETTDTTDTTETTETTDTTDTTETTGTTETTETTDTTDTGTTTAPTQPTTPPTEGNDSGGVTGPSGNSQIQGGSG
jgi:hypothetical protein